MSPAPKPGPVGPMVDCSLVLYGKGCWGVMLLRSTRGDGSPLWAADRTSASPPARCFALRHRLILSPLLSPRFPPSVSDPFITEEAASLPPAGLPQRRDGLL